MCHGLDVGQMRTSLKFAEFERLVSIKSYEIVVRHEKLNPVNLRTRKRN